jgi:hypothetical protein
MNKTGKANGGKIPNHIQFDTVSPATKLLEKRRMMYEVHEAFEQQKEEFRKQDEAFKRQEQLIRERDLTIQEELIRFCKFLQDNDAKKIRADKRYDEEKKAREQKEKDIVDLNLQLHELQKNATKLEKKVAALRKYEDYLENVAKQNSDQYTEQNDILTRYTTLEKANRSLKMNHQKKEQELAALRNEAAQHEKDKTNEILLLNTELAHLQKRRDDIEQKRNDLQTAVDNTTSESSNKNLNLGRILFAIDHLHQRCLDAVAKMKADGDDKMIFKQNLQQTAQQTLTQTQQDGENKKTLPSEKKETKMKTTKGENKDPKDQANEDEENFKKKCEQAVEKLKQIGAHMSDFNSIISDCEKEGAYKR